VLDISDVQSFRQEEFASRTVFLKLFYSIALFSLSACPFRARKPDVVN